MQSLGRSVNWLSCGALFIMQVVTAHQAQTWCCWNRLNHVSRDTMASVICRLACEPDRLEACFHHIASLPFLLFPYNDQITHTVLMFQTVQRAGELHRVSQSQILFWNLGIGVVVEVKWCVSVDDPAFSSCLLRVTNTRVSSCWNLMFHFLIWSWASCYGETGSSIAAHMISCSICSRVKAHVRVMGMYVSIFIQFYA